MFAPMKKLSKNIGIILAQNVIAAVVKQIHTGISEYAAHGAVLLGVIAGGNGGGHELPKGLRSVES